MITTDNLWSLQNQLAHSQTPISSSASMSFSALLAWMLRALRMPSISQDQAPNEFCKPGCFHGPYLLDVFAGFTGQVCLVFWVHVYEEFLKGQSISDCSEWCCMKQQVKQTQVDVPIQSLGAFFSPHNSIFSFKMVFSLNETHRSQELGILTRVHSAVQLDTIRNQDTCGSSRLHRMIQFPPFYTGLPSTWKQGCWNNLYSAGAESH